MIRNPEKATLVNRVKLKGTAIVNEFTNESHKHLEIGWKCDVYELIENGNYEIGFEDRFPGWVFWVGKNDLRFDR